MCTKGVQKFVGNDEWLIFGALVYSAGNGDNFLSLWADSM